MKFVNKLQIVLFNYIFTIMEDEKDISLGNIAPVISANHLKIIQDEFMTIIKTIQTKYNIKDPKYYEHYKDKVQGLNVKLGMKKRNRRVLEDEQRCMGRKIDGKQCTRSRLEESEFCKSHKENLPHGRYDNKDYVVPEKGKRGRKKKQKEYNKEEYIATTVQMIGKEQYLVDQNDFVYSYDIHYPTFIGKKINDEIFKIDNQTDLNKLKACIKI